MDDPHRVPGARDRDPLAERIRRAAEQGRIGAADRDIRLENVASAQSMAELDLIARNLDQLEAALPAATTSAQPWTGSSVTPADVPLTEQVTEATVQTAKSTLRSTGVVFALVLGLGLAVFSGLRFLSSDSSPRATDPFTQAPATAVQTPVASDPASPAVDPSIGGGGSAYGLDGPGVRGFLAEYRARFGTTWVVDLTLYPDYAVVQVPQGDRHRHSGFLYRPAQGWTDFGGVSADFPGAKPVDLTALDVPALVRNIARAQRTLNVEQPTTTYVIVRQYAPGDVVPSVDIHVANEFDESGYLATRLDGTVERSYPYTA